MSRGLGTWQRRIVDALTKREGAKNIYSIYPARVEPVIGGDFVHHKRGYGFYLAEGWHDMRQVSKELGIRKDNSKEATFSRALRTLAERGILHFVTLVPLEIDEIGTAHYLADGIYLETNQRFRFGKLQAPITGMEVSAS